MKILLYSRRGCHLCEQAEEMLATVAPEASVVDVDSSQHLAEAFGLRVPVVEIDGAVVLEGRFDEPALIAQLRARD